MRAYLAGPARKMAVRHVMRPAEATAIWLSLPCCHTSLVFFKTMSGSSSTRLCSTGTASLLLLAALDSLAGLDFDVSAPLGEVASPGSLQKNAAARKAHMRRARNLKRTTLVGDEMQQELCGTEEDKKLKKKRKQELSIQKHESHFHKINSCH